MKILAAIPCHNEEMAIGSCVLKARKYVDEMLMDAASAGLRIKEVEDSFISDREPHGATQVPELYNIVNIFQPAHSTTSPQCQPQQPEAAA